MILPLFYSGLAPARRRCGDLRTGDGRTRLPLLGRARGQGDRGGRPHALRQNPGTQLRPSGQQHCQRSQKGPGQGMKSHENRYKLIITTIAQKLPFTHRYLQEIPPLPGIVH